MNFGFNIAKRFLISNKAQTSLIIIGIAVGISVQIFIGSLIGGLQRSLIDKTIGNSPQITITKNKIFNMEDSIIEKIKSSSDDIKEISFSYNNNVLLESNNQSLSLLIRGFDLENANKIYNIEKSLIEGTMPINYSEIILGVSVRDKFNFSIGDNINVVDANKENHSYKIVGFFDLGVSSINSNWGIVSIETAQKMFGNYISSIELQVAYNEIFNVDIISKNIEKNIDSSYIVSNWKEDNASLLSGLQGQSISSLMIQVFVVVSVVLGISSVLAITVLQKSKQIGILKAMGLKNKVSLYIFLFEGFILGIIGGILGILFGLGLSYLFTVFAITSDGTPVVPLFIDYKFILLSFFISIFSSTLAALLPSLKSLKVNPIDIIRNN